MINKIIISDQVLQHGNCFLKRTLYTYGLSSWCTRCDMHQKNSILTEAEKWNFGDYDAFVDQDQDQDSLLVKRRNDNHSPGPVIRELVPSSHQRSELSNPILCIFSDEIRESGRAFINICTGNGSLKCHRMLISTTPSFGDKVIYWYTGFTF